jgi:hypothetical protein
MKRYLTIFVLLCTINTAKGAHFSHYGGGIRAFYEVYAENLPYIDGPWSGTQDGTTSANIEGSAVVFQANSYAGSNITRKSFGNSIRIKSESTANGYGAYSTCYARGQASGSTQSSQTKGIFYMIMPDGDEQTGDDVMVYYNDMLYVWSSGTTYVRIDGPGTMNHLAITRGLLPPVTGEPASEYEVLRFPQVEISNSGGDLFGGVHAFPAKIGDVIGIFADNYAKVDVWEASGEVYSEHTMILTVRAVLTGDLDYDGDVDFFDLAKLANNWLEGVGGEPPIEDDPPEPNPMQWAAGGEPKEIQCSPYYCATMTAEIATDPSGGIQYYFECVDEGGFSSSWQGSPTYTVTIGPSGHNYRFRVKARDLYLNETGYSPALPMN